tara:strand:- start:42 stop:335 length:294 start_codon:yes stop_codon:yes gene_type:complete
MSEIPNNNSINETLKIIKKALQEDDIKNSEEEDVLVLNQLVKNDGTIQTINKTNINKQEIKEMLNAKLTQVFEQNFENWLNKNIPNYLEKYFSNKEK